MGESMLDYLGGFNLIMCALKCGGWQRKSGSKRCNNGKGRDLKRFEDLAYYSWLWKQEKTLAKECG